MFSFQKKNFELEEFSNFILVKNLSVIGSKQIKGYTVHTVVRKVHHSHIRPKPSMLFPELLVVQIGRAPLFPVQSMSFSVAVFRRWCWTKGLTSCGAKSCKPGKVRHVSALVLPHHFENPQMSHRASACLYVICSIFHVEMKYSSIFSGSEWTK